MKKDEAIALVETKFPDQVIQKVRETNKYFLVAIMPKSMANKALPIIPCNDGLLAVDKSTKRVFTYNPIRDGE